MNNNTIIINTANDNSVNARVMLEKYVDGEFVVMYGWEYENLKPVNGKLTIDLDKNNALHTVDASYGGIFTTGCRLAVELPSGSDKMIIYDLVDFDADKCKTALDELNTPYSAMPIISVLYDRENRDIGMRLENGHKDGEVEIYILDKTTNNPTQRLTLHVLSNMTEVSFNIPGGVDLVRNDIYARWKDDDNQIFSYFKKGELKTTINDSIKILTHSIQTDKIIIKFINPATNGPVPTSNIKVTASYGGTQRSFGGVVNIVGNETVMYLTDSEMDALLAMDGEVSLVATWMDKNISSETYVLNINNIKPSGAFVNFVPHRSFTSFKTNTITLSFDSSDGFNGTFEVVKISTPNSSAPITFNQSSPTIDELRSGKFKVIISNIKGSSLDLLLNARITYRYKESGRLAVTNSGFLTTELPKIQPTAEYRREDGKLVIHPNHDIPEEESLGFEFKNITVYDFVGAVKRSVDSIYDNDNDVVVNDITADLGRMRYVRFKYSYAGRPDSAVIAVPIDFKYDLLVDDLKSEIQTAKFTILGNSVVLKDQSIYIPFPKNIIAGKTIDSRTYTYSSTERDIINKTFTFPSDIVSRNTSQDSFTTELTFVYDRGVNYEHKIINHNIISVIGSNPKETILDLDKISKFQISYNSSTLNTQDMGIAKVYNYRVEKIGYGEFRIYDPSYEYTYPYALKPDEIEFRFELVDVDKLETLPDDAEIPYKTFISTTNIIRWNKGLYVSDTDVLNGIPNAEKEEFKRLLLHDYKLRSFTFNQQFKNIVINNRNISPSRVSATLKYSKYITGRPDIEIIPSVMMPVTDEVRTVGDIKTLILKYRSELKVKFPYTRVVEAMPNIVTKKTYDLLKGASEDIDYYSINTLMTTLTGYTNIPLSNGNMIHTDSYWFAMREVDYNVFMDYMTSFSNYFDLLEDLKIEIVKDATEMKPAVQIFYSHFYTMSTNVGVYKDGICSTTRYESFTTSYKPIKNYNNVIDYYGDVVIIPGVDYINRMYSSIDFVRMALSSLDDTSEVAVVRSTINALQRFFPEYYRYEIPTFMSNLLELHKYHLPKHRINTYNNTRSFVVIAVNGYTIAKLNKDEIDENVDFLKSIVSTIPSKNPHLPQSVIDDYRDPSYSDVKNYAWKSPMIYIRKDGTVGDRRLVVHTCYVTNQNTLTLISKMYMYENLYEMVKANIDLTHIHIDLAISGEMEKLTLNTNTTYTASNITALYSNDIDTSTSFTGTQCIGITADDSIMSLYRKKLDYAKNPITNVTLENMTIRDFVLNIKDSHITQMLTNRNISTKIGFDTTTATIAERNLLTDRDVIIDESTSGVISNMTSSDRTLTPVSPVYTMTTEIIEMYAK